MPAKRMQRSVVLTGVLLTTSGQCCNIIVYELSPRMSCYWHGGIKFKKGFVHSLYPLQSKLKSCTHLTRGHSGSYTLIIKKRLNCIKCNIPAKRIHEISFPVSCPNRFQSIEGFRKMRIDRAAINRLQSF